MKTIIIAEAGVNHNGSIDIALKLIEKAAEAGADYIKFQTFRTEDLVSEKAAAAEYQVRNMGRVVSQFEMLKSLELTQNDYFLIQECCNKNRIKFLSTAFDFRSIDLLAMMNIPVWKIPSSEITNLPYLRKIAHQKKPIILSTGMATLAEVETSVNVLENNGIPRDYITLLHCTTEYPVPFNEVNLLAMVTLSEAFKMKVGYSDHTEGIAIPLAAVTLGASVVEKHFTLDRNMTGPDHKASLEPGELKEMILSINRIQMSLGDGIKKPTISELKNREIARKSIVAARVIKRGEIFSDENITVKRPGTGLTPMLWDEIIGLVADRDYKPDEIIKK